MSLNFTKMQSLGNDFVVIDAINQPVDMNAVTAARIAHRHTGIGCDQILLAEKPANGKADFRFRIFNADGSEVGQCGNGARCFMRFLRDNALTEKNEVRVETQTGLMSLRMTENGDDHYRVTVEMGTPDFEPRRIPLLADKRQQSYELQVDGQRVSLFCLAIGNPHAVMKVDDIDDSPINELGAKIENHVQFPQRVNVGFMQIIDTHHLRLRVYERGVGETLACGSGACAAVIAARQQGLLADSATVQLPGGEVEVKWEGEGKPVYLSGTATTVFDGIMNLEAL